MDDEILSDSVGLSDWIEAGVIVAAAVGIAVAINFATQRAVSRADSEQFAARFIGRLLASLAVVAGIVYALSSLHVRIGPLLGALGIGGLALAFALQDIIGNFAAGIILQIRRPMRPGDQILSHGHEGTVLEVNLRSTVIRSFDGETIYLPNAEVLKNPITNHTQRGSRRTRLIVGVEYSTDLDLAKSTILAAVRDVDGVLEVPVCEAFVQEFADSSINIAVLFWHRPQIAELWRVRDAVAVSVKKALDEADITIPFPQRTLRFAEPSDKDPAGR